MKTYDIDRFVLTVCGIALAGCIVWALAAFWGG